MVMYKPQQGDIVYLDFNPQSGHEQAGRRPAVVISNDKFFEKTKFAAVCPITNTDNKFPLHIPLDKRTKTKGMILTEHLKCLDVVSRNMQFEEKLPLDLTEKAITYVKTFF
jgi:mRNA interferase MazF